MIHNLVMYIAINQCKELTTNHIII